MVTLIAIAHRQIAKPATTDQASASGWEITPLPTKRSTRYTPRVIDGRQVIQADAESAVSLYRRRVHVAPAELGRVPSDDTWVQWFMEWDATPGTHYVAVRAVNKNGDLQIQERAPIAPNGSFCGTPSSRTSARLAPEPAIERTLIP